MSTTWQLHFYLKERNLFIIRFVLKLSQTSTEYIFHILPFFPTAYSLSTFLFIQCLPALFVMKK